MAAVRARSVQHVLDCAQMTDPRKPVDIKARLRADQAEWLRAVAEQRFAGNLSAALREALELAEKAERLRETAYDAWAGEDGDPGSMLYAYDMYAFLGGEVRLRVRTGEMRDTVGITAEEREAYLRMARGTAVSEEDGAQR